METIRDKVTVNGFGGLERHLTQFIKRGVDPQFSNDEWTIVLDWLTELHGKYFEKTMGPDSQTWPALSDYTVRRKGHSRILIEEERLIQSLTERQHPDAVRKFSLQELIFGTRRPWAWIHQSGTERIPKRMHTGIDAEHMNEIADVVGDAVLMHMFG